MDITELLGFGVDQGASDCHLSAGEPPMIRIDGDLKKLDSPPLTQEHVHALVYDIMSDGQRKIFEETHECDFSFALGGQSTFSCQCLHATQRRSARYFGRFRPRF